MTTWPALARTIEAHRMAALRDFEALFLALWQSFSTEGDVEGTRDAIELAARLRHHGAWDAAASTQLADLISVRSVPQKLRGVGVELSLERGKLVADRALEVLSGKSAEFVSPYARLAAQILVTDAARSGARDAGEYGGATHKTWMRVRQAQDPRLGHVRLEGVTLPIDRPFIVAGIPVFGPGDEALPWSERAACGHVLHFSRRKE